MKRASTRDAVVAILLAAAVAAAAVVSASAKSGGHASRTASVTPQTSTACPAPTPFPTQQPGLPTGALTDTPTATDTPAPTGTPTATDTPTNTPAPTGTPTPTNTPAPTGTPTPTDTPTNTPAPTGVPTSTSTPAPTNTPSPTATPVPFAGTARGKGEVNTACGVAHFDFHVERKTLGGPITGDLHYTNKGEGIDLHRKTITSFTISGKKADFGGTCTNHTAPCTFFVHVEDNGKPGKNTDVFEITITPPGTTEGGVIRSGEIEVRQT
jgi:hypothetical protein